MRIKIPHPIQALFSALGSGVGFPKHSSGKPGTDEFEGETSLLNPGVLIAIQDLCYDIFTAPNCSSEAISVAHTICGHIYDFAQHSNPAIRQLTLELLPTLVHVYLVLWTTPENTVMNQRRGRNNLLEALKMDPRSQSPPKKRVSSDFGDESANMHSRLRKKMRDKILIHSGGGASAAGGGSGSAGLFGSHSPSTVAKGGGGLVTEPQLTISAPSVLSCRADSLGTMSAILEACILGLYNTYVIEARSKEPRNNGLQVSLKCAIPPISDGTVFSGKLSSSERCRLLLDCTENSTGQSMEGNLPTPTECTRKSSLGSTSVLPWERLSMLRSHQNEVNFHLRFLHEDELNSKNRMSILRFLCRNYTHQITSLSQRSRESLCNLAILLGPYGLRNNSLPDRLMHNKDQKRRWNRFRRRRLGQRNINDQLNAVDVTSIVAASVPVDEEDDEDNEVDGDDDDDDDKDEDEGDQRDMQSKFLTSSDVHLADDMLEFLDQTDSLLSSPSESCSALSTQSNEGSFGIAISDEDFDKNEHNSKFNGTDPKSSEKQAVTSLQLKTSNATESDSEVAITANSRSHSASFRQRPSLTAAAAKDRRVNSGQQGKKSVVADPDVEKRKTETTATDRQRRGKGSGHHGHRRSSKGTRPPFGLKAPRGNKYAAASSTLSQLARIPQLSSGLVLDLLPGLHYLLGTEQAPIAARALLALSSRADLELWSDVILFLNGILNSKFFTDALELSKELVVDHGQNHSNSTLCEHGDDIEFVPKPRRSVVGRMKLSRPTFTFSSPTAAAKKERRQMRLQKAKSTVERPLERQLEQEKQQQQPPFLPEPVFHRGVITNASFQSVRPPEDIPVVVSASRQDENGTEQYSISPSSQLMPLRPRFAFSESPVDRRNKEEESPYSTSHPTPEGPLLPPFFQRPTKESILPSKCPGAERRTKSFNAKLSGSHHRRMKYPATVTFAEPPIPRPKLAPTPPSSHLLRSTSLRVKQLTLTNEHNHHEQPSYASSL